ncbi:efflux RND transporter periplasmic adaptor subunit [Puniceibacterium sediminis]|uniref:Membrane fusion protein, multidrug efflux system n=1 Tax=Puniceibacterium sediminis TaxID=1608407 RepID=A0A238WVC1_9RHOB|nr:efflux RND transporter periplasmic adaptor subunit [Puniceibacterium sediminis]SNR50321.1 membrane fusion protein, multidrug efflux system [Puniceibacterium sediminis]
MIPNRFLISLTLGILMAPVLSGSAFAQGQERPPTAVTVVTVQPEIVTLTSTLPGRVVASAAAEVRPQVAGIITERLFTEGGQVEAGDVLFTIDPATYEANVSQARAQVTLAQAQLSAAEKELTRFEELRQRNVASDQSYDSALAARESAAASLQVSQAQLQAAEIELDRTNIRARLSGEIGRSLTSQGALVTASQADPLAVIRNIDPIYVDVTQSAAEVLQWRRGNGVEGLGDAARAVSLTLADGSIFSETGSLTAAEPDVDEQTGVVVLRMGFANPEKLLLPGMYVQVEMPTQLIEGAFRVPQEGVSRDRRGQPIAMIVNAENAVQQVSLTIAQDIGSDWIVTDGLNAGDKVILEGLQKIQPGATVAPEERVTAAGAASAPAEKTE